MEIVITVAITAMVFAMVSAILFSVLDASELVNEKLQTEKVGYGCLSLLRRDVEATYAYALGTPALKGERGTEGGKEGDRLWLLVARMSAPDASGNSSRFQKVAYRVAASGDKGVLGLYRRAAPWQPGDDPLSGGEYSLVYQGISMFALSYFDPKEKKWVDGDWKETDRIPRAVRIQVELARDPNREATAAATGVDLPPLHFETIAGITAYSDMPPPPQDPAAPTSTPH
jgi:hypothetical protein